MARQRQLTAIILLLALAAVTAVQAGASVPDSMYTSVRVVGSNCDPSPPTANFIGHPTCGDAPLTVHFIDCSVGTYNNRAWDFGDGETASGYLVSHTYSTPGTYTVSLTVWDCCRSDYYDTRIKEDYITVTCGGCDDPEDPCDPGDPDDPGDPCDPGDPDDPGDPCDPGDPNDPTVPNNPADPNSGEDDGPSDGGTTDAILLRSGGGGGTAEFNFIENGTLLVSDEGKVLHTVTITSRDGVATLTIPQNVYALSIEGEPITEISIKPATDMEESGGFGNGIFSYAGYAYQCTPAFGTFDPPITLTLVFTPEEWAALDGQDLLVGCWHEEGEEWLETATIIDPDGCTITAKVTHFSTFALLARINGGDGGPGATGSDEPDPTASAETEGTLSVSVVEPAATSQHGMVSIITFLVIVAAVAGLYYYRRR